MFAPGGVEHYIDVLKALQLGPAFWMPLKTMALFPLFYHTANGFRHLVSVSMNSMKLVIPLH